MIGIVLYGLVIGALALLVLYKPGYALTAVLLMFLLDQLGVLSHTFFMYNGNLTNIIIGSIVLLAAIRNHAQWSANLKGFGTTFTLVVCLLLYTYLSAMWSPVAEIALDKIKSQLPYHLTFFVILPLCMQDRKTLKEALLLTLVFGTVISYYLIFGTEWQARGLVLQGGQEELIALPLALAEVAGFLVIIAALINIDNRAFGLLLKVAAVLAGLILCLKTGSRGQLLFMLMVAGYYHMRISGRFDAKQMAITMFAGLVSCAALYFLFSIFLGGGISRWSPEALSQDVTGRFAASFVMLAEWSKSVVSILFGLGNSASFNPLVLGFYPHNVYFETLAEEGIIGFGLLMAILLKSVVNQRIKVLRDPSVVICAALATFFFLLAFKQGSLITNTYLFVFPLLLELFTRQSMQAEQTQPDDKVKPEMRPLFNFVR